jgi:mRNA deadenylase 3'-5' endonuclease subunit Ccr4
METQNSVKFSVLQWNILDPEFSTKKTFPSIDETFLNWENRFNKIVQLIEKLSPDIICFEEAKADFALPSEKYEFLYLEKGHLSHGLFVAYKREIFERIAYEYEFFQTSDEISSQNFIFLNLRHRQTHSHISLIVTHLKSKNFQGNRLRSVNQIIKFLEHRKIKANLLICGDFNAEEKEESIILLKDRLQLHSVRSGLYTTIRWDPFIKIFRKKKIDYIFHSPSDLKLISDWSSNEGVAESDEVIPSSECPSDHLPVFAVFQFEQRMSKLVPKL